MEKCPVRKRVPEDKCSILIESISKAGITTNQETFEYILGLPKFAINFTDN